MAWDETGLSGLQAQLAHEMVSRVTAFTFGPDVRLVRGVMTSPDRPGAGRVVLWDGQRLDSSVAFDVPLTDAQGGNIPAGDIAAALRGVASDWPEHETEKAPRDAFGIPVIDASALVHAFVAEPRFKVPDALHAAAAAFSLSPEPEDPAELRLRGFLLLDQATYRLYLDTPESQDAPPFGIDLPIQDEKGAVTVGVTAVHAALPVLLLGELERMRKDAHDPYCHTVYDMVAWLSDS
ncbi:hypothetical protein ABT189_09580 [Streptomyces sp900105755]|uniref:hypothetical protein n=1 Tax=Streptomyces sp. 900105755 TaxID=3154389 RepID=UPI00331C918A